MVGVLSVVDGDGIGVASLLGEGGIGFVLDIEGDGDKAVEASFCRAWMEDVAQSSRRGRVGAVVDGVSVLSDGDPAGLGRPAETCSFAGHDGRVVVLCLGLDDGEVERQQRIAVLVGGIFVDSDARSSEGVTFPDVRFAGSYGIRFDCRRCQREGDGDGAVASFCGLENLCMLAAGDVYAVAPGIGATTLDGGGDDGVVYRVDGEVQYEEGVTRKVGMYARGGVGCSVDRPGVRGTRVDGRVNVDGCVVLSVHSQWHHHCSQKKEEYSFFHLAD